jgi:DNA-binding MarR family transcriptional regulator
MALCVRVVSHIHKPAFLMLGLGKCHTAADLSRDLFIDSAAMKRTLDKLESKGFLLRTQDPADKPFSSWN